jgi:hypothetical protein
VIAVGIAAACYWFHPREPHSAIAEALKRANKHAINWNKGKHLMKASKLPVRHYMHLILALEKNPNEVPNEQRLAMDRSKPVKILKNDRASKDAKKQAKKAARTNKAAAATSAKSKASKFSSSDSSEPSVELENEEASAVEKKNADAASAPAKPLYRQLKEIEANPGVLGKRKTRKSIKLKGFVVEKKKATEKKRGKKNEKK